MERDAAIRLRADGSIDTGYYIAIGRQCRADQGRILAGGAARLMWPLRVAVVVVVAGVCFGIGMPGF